MKKLFILGQGRAGKDFACEILAKEFGFKHISSSLFVCEKAVYPVLQSKYGYISPEDCYSERHLMRKEWFDLISEYNRADPSRLSTELFQQYDIYCGLRSATELEASRHLADIVVWIDATDRLGISESSDSITITKEMADIIIENNGTKEEFEKKIKKFGELICK